MIRHFFAWYSHKEDHLDYMFMMGMLYMLYRLWLDFSALCVGFFCKMWSFDRDILFIFFYIYSNQVIMLKTIAKCKIKIQNFAPSEKKPSSYILYAWTFKSREH